MDLKWIEDFLFLSKYGSFAKAAEARNITQPAFGRRIKLLEEWVGASLVDRNTYPTTLTKEGACFLEHADELIKQINYIKLDTIGSFNKNKEKVTFHTQHSLSEYIINKLIKKNKIIFDKNMISVNPNNLHDSIQTFLQNRSDLLIALSFKKMPLSISSPGLESIVIGSDSLIPVVASQDDGTPIYQDFENTTVPLLHYPKDTFFYQIIEKYGVKTQSKCSFNLRYENPITHSLKSMALDGHGVTWLPQKFIQDEINQKKLAYFSQNIPPITAQIKLYRFSSSEKIINIDEMWDEMKNPNLYLD